MTDTTGKQLTSKLDADGTLTVELVEQTFPQPTGHEVLIRVEAAPINPSDLGLLFASADVANATYSPGKVVAQMPAPAVRAMAARYGHALPVGNEGAGTVIAAGEEPDAQALIGKLVACVPGGMYADYRVVDSRTCMTLPDGLTAEQGAAAYVNPLTALGFVETMRRDGFTGIVHSAAASNLGQMLVKICHEDNVPLVNIVRSPEQVALLKALGAEYVVDSSAESFLTDLAAAIEATGAMCLFDAIGGGKLVGQVLTVMEQVANKGAAFSRYGSNAPKHAFIFGALDLAPTMLNRSFGFSWGISGWLLTPFMVKAGEHVVERMRARVRDGLTTTFASAYKARVSLDQALTKDAVLEYNARRTGEKYLIVPNS